MDNNTVTVKLDKETRTTLASIAHSLETLVELLPDYTFENESGNCYLRVNGSIDTYEQN